MQPGQLPHAKGHVISVLARSCAPFALRWRAARVIVVLRVASWRRDTQPRGPTLVAVACDYCASFRAPSLSYWLTCPRAELNCLVSSADAPRFCSRDALPLWLKRLAALADHSAPGLTCPLNLALARRVPWSPASCASHPTLPPSPPPPIWGNWTHWPIWANLRYVGLAWADLRRSGYLGWTWAHLGFLGLVQLLQVFGYPSN